VKQALVLYVMRNRQCTGRATAGLAAYCPSVIAVVRHRRPGELPGGEDGSRDNEEAAHDNARPVPPELIEECLEIAVQAPQGSNLCR
jgi:hypothetical protein